MPDIIVHHTYFSFGHGMTTNDDDNDVDDKTQDFVQPVM